MNILGWGGGASQSTCGVFEASFVIVSNQNKVVGGKLFQIIWVRFVHAHALNQTEVYHREANL